MADVKIQLNEAGFIEGIDPETGDVLWTEKRKTVVKNGKIVKASSPGRGRRKKEDKETHHFVKDGRGELLWVPKGTNPDHLPKVAWPYNQTTCNHICQLLTEGKTLKEIGATQGFPPTGVIYGWARKYPEFRAEIKKAKEARAEWYADQVMEIAFKDIDPREVNVERLRADILKWGAEVGNPDEYGKKTKISGDANAPIQFIVDTGVRRAEDEPIEVESVEVLG